MLKAVITQDTFSSVVSPFTIFESQVFFRLILSSRKLYVLAQNASERPSMCQVCWKRETGWWWLFLAWLPHLMSFRVLKADLPQTRNRLGRSPQRLYHNNLLVSCIFWDAGIPFFLFGQIK